VLANDTDPDSDGLTIVSYASANSETAQHFINGDASFTINPEGDYVFDWTGALPATDLTLSIDYFAFEVTTRRDTILAGWTFRSRLRRRYLPLNQDDLLG
jgi:Cadherin-like domain